MCILLGFIYQNIIMMHGPINIKFIIKFVYLFVCWSVRSHYFLTRLHCVTDCRVVTRLLYSGDPVFKSRSPVHTLTENLCFFLNPSK